MIHFIWGALCLLKLATYPLERTCFPLRCHRFLYGLFFAVHWFILVLWGERWMSEILYTSTHTLRTFKIVLKCPFGIMDNYWLLLTSTRPESAGQAASQFSDVDKRANGGCRVEEESKGRRWRASLEWTKVGSKKMQEFRAYLPPSCPAKGKIAPPPLNSSTKCLHFCSGECNSPINVMSNNFTLFLFMHHFQRWSCAVKKKRIQ